jgi:hypothetical protein
MHVVLLEPDVEVLLKFFERFVDFLSERDLVELMKDRFVKPLADAVCLRALRFRLCVVDVSWCQVELVLVPFDIAAVPGPPNRHDPQNGDFLGLIERNDTVIQKIGCGERRLLRVEFAGGVSATVVMAFFSLLESVEVPKQGTMTASSF